VLWSIDREMLSQLDITEDYPRLYDRKTVPVFVDGQRVEAFVYTMTPHTRDQLKNTYPRRSYVMRLARGYQAGGVPISQLQTSLSEATDPKFMKFMNTSLGNRVDAKPTRYDPNTIMGSHNMPGYRKAFKFGMDVIKRLDQETKKHFAQADDDEFYSYLVSIAEQKGLIPRSFLEEDLSEVTGEFEEIFHDPEMEGWSWADLLRDSIGQPVRAHDKANVQAYKQMMAQAQAAKDNPPPIDPANLKVVNRTDTGKSEIWYPHFGKFDGAPWTTIQTGFRDKADAEQALVQLRKNPNVVKIIQQAISNASK